MPAAAGLVERIFAADLGPGGELELRDHKSALQEWLQGRGRPLPDYEVQAEQGPAHHKLFRVACRVEGELLAEGEGSSKKAAQQQAARLALAALQQQPARRSSVHGVPHGSQARLWACRLWM